MYSRGLGYDSYSYIIVNLIRKHLNQLNLYDLKFMRIRFNITAEVWNLTPNCWDSEYIFLSDKDQTRFQTIFNMRVCVWIYMIMKLGNKTLEFIENLEFIKS